jgi:rRNA maturation endonuclease Nob1
LSSGALSNTPTQNVTDNATSSHTPQNVDSAEDRGIEGDRNPEPDIETEDDGLESIEQTLERLDVDLVPLEVHDSQEQPNTPAEAASSADHSESPHVDTPSHPPLYEDPEGEDDSEGEWITPENVSLHKARALGLTPSEEGSVKGRNNEIIPVGCMTADFAMQNVLLQMDLSLVGMEGKKIQKVKTWVLRCHACFKYVRHLPGTSLAHPQAGSVRMRLKSSALRAAIPHCFARLLLYHPPPPLQMRLPCKCT